MIFPTSAIDLQGASLVPVRNPEGILNANTFKLRINIIIYNKETCLHNIKDLFLHKMTNMTKNKIQIKREGKLITVLDEKGHVLCSSTRHSVVRKDEHPYMTGFSKIADLGNNYSEMLTLLRLNNTSNRIRDYWENVGNYALNIMTK